MPVIASIDGPNRRIYLSADTVNATVTPVEIYREERALRRTDESLRQFDKFMEMSGNESTGPSTATARIGRLLDGTRIVPFDTSHELTIAGHQLITDDGQSGIGCFDRTPLSVSTVVDINYVPPQVEVITILSGSGVTETDKDDIRDRLLNATIASFNTVGTFGEAVNDINLRALELWQRLGLDSANPLVSNEDGSISVGSITISAVTTGSEPNRSTTQTRS